MNLIEIEDQHYILATSSLIDQRTMVLKDDDSFAVFDWHGDIHQVGASGKQGIYHCDTRYLSAMELHLDGVRPVLLSGSPREDNQMLMIDLTNPDLIDKEKVILHGTIHLLRSKFLWRSAYHEKISIRNYDLEPVSFSLDIRFDADFVDIFEVRGTVRERRGIKEPIVRENGSLQFSYKGLDDIVRTTNISLTPIPDAFNHNSAVYLIRLDPKQQIELEITISFSDNQEPPAITLPFGNAKSALNAYMERVGAYCADIITSNDQFNDWLKRSKSDLITMTTQTSRGLYPYAGIPWYSTPFGRDGIITAMECLWAEPEIAKGVLMYLARTQARDFNDFQDAEPGKIFHETRGGEMAALGEVPFELYYGTVDATPLFICLAGRYLRRTNDLVTISEIWPNIQQALFWIDHYGDLDGDGFVEYATKSHKGLTNQGWKDSQDAIFYESGGLAEYPIALCEVQGYVYEAKVRACEIARALDDDLAADRLKREAALLKENFNKAFWSETKQTYFLALDGQKKPCNVASSNAGHCLFSGIASPEHASSVAKSLLGEPMFSGWGIRTIADDEVRYNPMSYHNGSIWPHDNAIIAGGFSRYGLMRETIQVLTATFDTASYMQSYRLAELFCGLPRERGQGPTSYPVACSPQAWSVGAVFLMLQACLGMEIDALTDTIIFCHPVLPSFINEVTITNLRLNNKSIILQVRQGKEGLDAAILGPDNGVKIKVVNSVAEEEPVG